MSKLQILEQQTARINGQQAQAAGGVNAHAAAQAELAEKAGASARALEHATEIGKRFGEEFVSSAARIGASLIGFEAVVQTIDKVTEAAREAEVAERQLTARFGEQAGEFREFSEQSARGTNFTAIQFERAAATLQPLTRDYRLTNEELQDLIRNTADLAAANGIGLVQAASDVEGSMRGQTRAGRELGLNLRADVIAGMDGLSVAEKRAAAEGDNVASAHARLKVIALDAASVQGQAAEAAAAAGDNFAKLDKATGTLWETMAQSSGVGGVIDVFGRAANGASDLIRLVDLLNAKFREYRFQHPELDAGQAYLAFEASTTRGTLNRDLEAGGPGGRGTGGFAGLEGFPQPERWMPAIFEHEKNAVYAATKADEAAAKANTNLRDLYLDESVRLDNVAAALDSRTQAQLEAIQTQTDFRDETYRAIEAERAYGTELERTAAKVSQYEQRLQKLGSGEGQLDRFISGLRADRTLLRRLGLDHGQDDALLADALQRKIGVGLATGEALRGEYGADRARELAGGSFFDLPVSVGEQTVNAQVVNINGQAGGGQYSNISGRGAPTVPDRYDRLRYASPWAVGVGGALRQ